MRGFSDHMATSMQLPIDLETNSVPLLDYIQFQIAICEEIGRCHIVSRPVHLLIHGIDHNNIILPKSYVLGGTDLWWRSFFPEDQKWLNMVQKGLLQQLNCQKHTKKSCGYFLQLAKVRPEWKFLFSWPTFAPHRQWLGDSAKCTILSPMAWCTFPKFRFHCNADALLATVRCNAGPEPGFTQQCASSGDAHCVLLGSPT